MKTVALIAALTAGCGGFDRSQGFACETTATCDPARVCEGGYCVIGEREIDGAIPLDAQFDASNDAPGCGAWMTPHIGDGCQLQPPGPIDLSLQGDYVFDTFDGSLLAPGSTTKTFPPSAMVMGGLGLSVDAFTIPPSTRLRVIGPRPLVVASWSTIEIMGEIDASSVLGQPGAGTNSDLMCVGRAATAGGPHTGGGGGGGGGGHHGAGGNGGIGDIVNPATGTAGIGGGALATLPLLLGGCGGARGGRGDSGFAGGIGGRGGGAIQLTARNSLTITGKVHAGGEGGAGATASGNNNGDGDGGGGGGGAGGMIGLDAPVVMVALGAVIAVNGGGGGGGADDQPGMRGASGAIASTRAMGGTGGAMTGDPGGPGAAGAILVGGTGTGTGNDGEDGAGGGGGGVGWIVVRSPSPTLNGTLSPLATTAP